MDRMYSAKAYRICWFQDAGRFIGFWLVSGFFSRPRDGVAFVAEKDHTSHRIHFIIPKTNNLITTTRIDFDSLVVTCVVVTYFLKPASFTE